MCSKYTYCTELFTLYMCSLNTACSLACLITIACAFPKYSACSLACLITLAWRLSWETYRPQKPELLSVRAFLKTRTCIWNTNSLQSRGQAFGFALHASQRNIDSQPQSILLVRQAPNRPVLIYRIACLTGALRQFSFATVQATQNRLDNNNHLNVKLRHSSP